MQRGLLTSTVVSDKGRDFLRPEDASSVRYESFDMISMPCVLTDQSHVYDC